MKALIVYHSRKGTTRKFAEEIAAKLEYEKHNVVLKDINDAEQNDLSDCDIFFMGCWTSGRFLIGQKPEKLWVNFALQLPNTNSKKTVLFTTYTIITGSMFRNMKKYILPKGYKVIGSMKSRNGKIDYYSNMILKYSLN